MTAVCALLQPFSGYVPAAPFGSRVAGPPASTLSAEQVEAARKDPHSFRYSLGRSAGSSHADAVEWIERYRRQGVLQPIGPGVLVYRQTTGTTTATGLIADVSLAAYDSGRVERHEKTIAKTQQKMARYMRTTRVYGNPVALGHRFDPTIKEVTDAHTGRTPDFTFTTMDGLRHELWLIEGDVAQSLCRDFDDVVYVTDGHHRLAAASLVAGEEKRANAFLPAGLFAADQLRLRSFARCVLHSPIAAEQAISRLSTDHHLIEVDAAEARPSARGEYGLGIAGRYFRLRLGSSEIPADPYESLDVNLLQNLILGPVFGVTDQTDNRRIHFVADLSETSHLDLDAKVWFLPFPAAVEDVMAVADSGRVMPPKSTLFTPKLPAGLVIRPIDTA